MPGKVTDPALLAELESGSAGKVSDPALLAQLEGGGSPGPLRWVQKAGEGLIPGYNRIAAAIDAGIGDPLTGDARFGKTFGERYANRLRGSQAMSRKTLRENPYLAPLVQGAGAALMALLVPAAPAAQEAGLLSRAASGAAATAPVGAAYAAGDAPADATTGDILTRTALGGLTAGGIGAAVPVAGAVAAPAARKLQKVAIEQGRKALSGVGAPLSARRPIPEAAVQEALDVGAIRPLGTVGGTATRLERSADTLGAEYGAILRELEAQGVKGPNAILLGRKILAEAEAARKVSLGSARPEILEGAGLELQGLRRGMHGVVPGTPKVDPRPFADKRLALGQAEEIKRGLQNEAKREYDKITRQYTTSGETKKELAAIVRAAIEDEVSAQASKAPAAAASFEPVKARLSNTLEALKHAEEGAARAARRKPVSLTSTIAGSAAGAATGSPIVGVLSALGHGVMDARLASTLASGANLGARALRSAAPSAVGAGVRAALPVESDPIVRALMEALTRKGVRLVPAAAEEDRR